MKTGIGTQKIRNHAVQTDNFGSGQALDALNIAAGGMVTLGTPGPAPVGAVFATDFDLAERGRE